ncbi:LysR family transcriptional regulator [Bradyrhizobium sp. SRS-191]|uniref:LysR family transcriptional regulator n=1 Tax=Bradyrhizobium sp. SRS-191 TaxID=2962606 RepID=UPI00211E4CB8|nr:LysR family transcriptional regulator [Bradyrhizobium sp. SRS-191]
MLDGISLDQLRTFVAAAEAGSFSAAGRKLGRAQSVISQNLANLEAQLEVRLFDRTGRYPVLTPAGCALLADARAVTDGLAELKARARGLAQGLEPELSIAMNVLFPTAVLTDAVAAFQQTFPGTPLRVSVEGMGAVIEPVLEKRCAFGIRGPLLTGHPDLRSEPLRDIRYLMVASARHPLARCKGAIPPDLLSEHVQLVLTDRSRLTEGKDLRVFSSRTWRLSDLGAKHAFLRAGLGWGGMPFHVVEADLASGALVPLALAEAEADTQIRMSAVYRTDTPPGPAGRWLIDRLKQVD